jgi:diaminopimelate epimerase
MAGSHYSGCGNDFIIIDDRHEAFDITKASFVRKLCSQAKVDGLILIRHSPIADFRMLFFNNDGSRASMCGNGIRCMAQYIRQKLQYNKDHCQIETDKGVLKVYYKDPLISVDMGTITTVAWDLDLSCEEKTYRFHLLDSGVPHLITFVNDVETIPIDTHGAYFRKLKNANVNFVDIQKKRIRTFERGVEGETLACGTGVTAAAFALNQKQDVAFPIRLQVRSGDFLEIDMIDTNLIMTGPAVWISDLNLQ